ncbi:MAG: 16S rRNA (cytosine(1402)-N(4))-methyltransferase RsmH [Verrucomicrobiaceae bacterium]|nr:MAG: 16S rRNA (cytosine(1402)-N(4))-methyltransferase RsmH [Verrucomicrobiaceae bacterium]
MSFLDCEDLLELPLEKTDESGRVYHVPVMPDEVVALLRPAPGMLFLDGTIGGGGHSEKLLEAGADVIGLDQDTEALTEAGKKLARFGSHLRLVEANFREAESVLDDLGERRGLAGALLDIGVSSHQLDTAGRGFALMKDGPLDMRMSLSAPMTAADMVNTMPVAELAGIFREFGEEPRAMQIASRIDSLRARHPFRTTFDLAAAVSSVAPRTGGKHPATRVFQALRIAVNDELGALREALETIPPSLAPGGRLAVITFHSLEDRIVKHFFRERSQEWVDRPEWPEPRRNPDRIFRLLTPHPIDAGMEETTANPRARSAKLRVVEKIQENLP